MAVTNKAREVSQDLLLHLAISRDTATLSPELIDELQTIPDKLIACEEDDEGDRVATIPISVLATGEEGALLVPGGDLKLVFWLNRYTYPDLEPTLIAGTYHAERYNIVGDSTLLVKRVEFREEQLREHFRNPSWILPSLRTETDALLSLDLL